MLTRGHEVHIDEAAFIHPTALLYGKIKIGMNASVFPYVVMRSEVHEIRIFDPDMFCQAQAAISVIANLCWFELHAAN